MTRATALTASPAHPPVPHPGARRATSAVRGASGPHTGAGGHPLHDVKGSDLEQWKTDAKQTILWPDKYATGKINYPYTEAKKGVAAATASKEGSSSK